MGLPNRSDIRPIAIGLFVLGAGLAIATYLFAESLPNHLRLLGLLPLTFSVALLHWPTFTLWASASKSDRFNAVGSVLLPIILAVGAIIWFVAAPNARA